MTPAVDQRTNHLLAPTSARRVLLKGLGLFVVLNLLFAWWYPMNSLGRLSLYNRLIPGRVRLPYGDDPARSNSLSLYNLEAMFASHELAASPKEPDEYRVLLIGDSSTWGFLLPPEETLAAALNRLGLELPDGRRVRAYNLGYPVMSLTKDLMILSSALEYQPDLVIWPVTLESFPKDKQLFPPLVQNNPRLVRSLIETYGLDLNPHDMSFVEPGFLQRTIVGSRRPIADWLRLQLYGLMWAATGIDQDIPQSFVPRMEDLPPDDRFHDLEPPSLPEDTLSLDVLKAGAEMLGDTPLLIVNEPMLISSGVNSDIRYNFYYPRWAYDDYREMMARASTAQQWNYLDLWDTVPGSEFTNSAVHLTPRGTRMLAERLAEAVLQIESRQP